MLDFGEGRETEMKSVDRILVQNLRQRIQGLNGKQKKTAATPHITFIIFHLIKFDFRGSKFEFVQIEKILQNKLFHCFGI